VSVSTPLQAVFERRVALVAIACLLLCAFASGTLTIKGTVQNATTGTPSAGDNVILLDGTGEAGRAKTAADGTFSIDFASSENQSAPTMLRVVHGGVSYDQLIRTETFTKIVVYDSSKVVRGLGDYICILQFQTHGHWLEVTELHSIRNNSSPPKTQLSRNNFDIVVPNGAQIRSVTVAGPSNEVLAVLATLVQGERNRYQIPFPLLPGLTRYIIEYEVPYDDKASYRRTITYPTKQFSIMLPSAMSVTSLGASVFQHAVDQKGIQIEILSSPKPGETVAFTISGTGAMARYLSPKTPAHSSIPALPRPFPIAKSALRKESTPIATGPTESRSPPIRQFRWTPFAVCVLAVGGILFMVGYFKRFVNRIRGWY
jgi:hypothetical protein